MSEMAAEQFVPDFLPVDGDGGGEDDGLDHYYCCDPEKARCGIDLSEATETNFPDNTPRVCVVCADLADKSCGDECTRF